MKLSEQRNHLIEEFLAQAGLAGASRRPLAGDASVRRYERVTASNGTLVLMDWPAAADDPPLPTGNGQKPYSAIAHIAESVHPFCAIAEALRAQDISAPQLVATNLDAGLLLLEDFGDALYGQLIDDGNKVNPLYEMAVDLLTMLAERNPSTTIAPTAFTPAYNIPPFDEDAFLIEAQLLMDWYWPAIAGQLPSEEARERFTAVMKDLFYALSPLPRTLVLRDFHSPNLIWLEERRDIARVGVIDFQDALIGPAAYDLVSLLQDARREVPQEREEKMLTRYISARRSAPRFSEEDFRRDYAILGAQRAAKIIGIFCRLAVRDGKPHYLAHIPRVWRYMTRNLSHADLQPLTYFLDEAFPSATRLRPPQVVSL
jgi:aminoglycoside/choline kinase family phosphotransferase